MAKKESKVKWPKVESYLVPLFHSSWVYLFTTPEDWKQAHRHLGVDLNNLVRINGCVRHFYEASTGENMYMIGVFDGKVSTLVHECAHACFYVCSDVGVPIDTSEPNETYCYMLERMFERFLPHIKVNEERQDGK